MVTRIGNFCTISVRVLLLMCTGFSAAETLELRVINTQGIPLTTVGRGIPFSVAVLVKGNETLRSWPTVDGLSHFRVVGQRSDVNVAMHGSVQSQEKRFIYNLVADTPGKFTIGPARAESLESGTQTVTVLDAQHSRKEQYSLPTYQLILEKKIVVVGEKVPFILRFTFQDPGLTLTDVATPQASGLRMGPLGEGLARSEMIHGELFQIIEYKGYLFPERAGVFTISPLQAAYTEKAKNQAWGFFGMGHFAQKKSLVSQPVTLSVDDVPGGSSVQGVGSFENFTAHLSAQEVAQSEAVILTLSIEGDGDMEKMAPPLLKMPDTIRYYDSKSSSESKGPRSIKKWEYVLQGLKEGIYTIKEQVFKYFDTKTRSVKTLKTKPITLTITAPSLVQAPFEEESKVHAELSSTADQQDETGLKIPFSRTQLPLPLFIIFFLIPPLYVGLRFLFPAVQPVIQKLKCLWISRWALLSASWRIKKACKAGDLSLIYSIMKKACGDYYCAESDEDSVGILSRHGWSKEAMNEWIAFERELLTYSHYAPQSSPYTIRTKAVCKMAEQWLAKFRKGPL